MHGKYSPASLPAWSDAASRSTRIFSPVDVNRADSTFGGGPVRSRTFSHDSSVGAGTGMAVGFPGVTLGAGVGLGVGLGVVGCAVGRNVGPDVDRASIQPC